MGHLKKHPHYVDIIDKKVYCLPHKIGKMRGMEGVQLYCLQHFQQKKFLYQAASCIALEMK